MTDDSVMYIFGHKREQCVNNRFVFIFSLSRPTVVLNEGIYLFALYTANKVYETRNVC